MAYATLCEVDVKLIYKAAPNPKAVADNSMDLDKLLNEMQTGFKTDYSRGHMTLPSVHKNFNSDFAVTAYYFRK